MTADEVVAALGLPDSSRVDRRVPKTLLVEHGAPTATDKRQINDRIEALTWVATLKPNTIGVPEYRDAVREYVEIAVLRMDLRDPSGGGGRTPARLVDLVHRAVPYPVILIADDRPAGCVSLSAAHKRWSHGEAGRTVLDDEAVAVKWSDRAPGLGDAERAALALARQPRASMFATYQGWLDTLTAILAARITGTFSTSTAAERGTDRRAALREWDELDAEIARVRGAAKKERQMSRQVELNTTLKKLEARRASILERLQ
jgi:hypothetical protein